MIEDLHIDPKWKNIGIKLSGGADSSILYYALCNYYRDRDDVNIYPITRDTEEKWWYSRGAKTVIDCVTELTGKSPAEWYVVYPDDFKNQIEAPGHDPGTSKMEEAAKIYNLDVLYVGLTKNPPLDDMRKYFLENSSNLDVSRVMDYIDTRDSTRDVQVEQTISTVVHHGKELTQVVPFASLDKRAVKQMYEHYGVLDKLYPFTYSCESEPESKTKPLTHCCYCFFCLERQWGFNRII